MQYCFGIDIGGTTVKMGVFRADGELMDKWEIKTRTENKGAEILSDVVESIQAKMKEHHILKNEVIGLGVGVPAPVKKDGFVKSTANLGWENKDVKGELESLTGLKVNVANDANVAALGEMWQGGGRGHQNMVMVTLGTGVGGGILMDGHIHTGVNGAGGEIGHICVNDAETERCGCGKHGCLEQYASATGIVRLAKKKLSENTAQTILDAENVTAKDVFDALKNEDRVAKDIVEEFSACLGHALANLSVILDTEVFVIGGGVSKAGEILIQYVQKHYLKNVYWANKEVEFKLAQLGNDAGIVGAAKLALE